MSRGENRKNLIVTPEELMNQENFVVSRENNDRKLKFRYSNAPIISNKYFHTEIFPASLRQNAC